MSKRKKVLLWIGLLVSLPIAGYAGMCVVFYAWLDASRQWPTEKAAMWAYGSLSIMIIFSALFIYCLVSLIWNANREYKAENKIMQASAFK